MGVDTKGFVLTKEKNPFKVFATIKDALFAEIKRETGINSVAAVWGKKYSMPSAELSDMEGYFRISLTYRGEQRDISVHLSCDNDYDYVKKGKRIIVSLGAWGSSVHLIETVIRALTVYGRGWMCDEDTAENWREVK